MPLLLTKKRLLLTKMPYEQRPSHYSKPVCIQLSTTVNDLFTVVKHPIFLQETLLDEKGQPWFVGKDVAEKLDYKKSRNALMAHVDGEAIKGALNQGSLVVLQIKTIANERGTSKWTLLNTKSLYHIL